MSDTDIKIEFNCNGFSAPAYSCSKAGDNSGVYVQSTDYDALVDQNKALRLALKYCIEEADMGGSRELPYWIAELLEQSK